MKSLIAKSAVASIVFATGIMPGWAQDAITPDERASAVLELAQVIEDEFFDEERAVQIAAELREMEDAGRFDDVTNAQELASALSEHLHVEDRHFRVNFRGVEAVAEAMARAEARGDAPSDEQLDAQLASLRRINFAFDRVEILPGNVGYIKLNGFAPIAPAEETARAALAFIQHTDAVIFDLRDNGGGDPTMVQYLTSHFLEPGGGTLINTFVSRDFEYPNQLWSLPAHPAGHRPDTPVYVLTSGRTASAAEGFSYHLQAMERGVLVGDTTYGAGNPGGTFLTDEGYEIFISTGSARNPITLSNWEGTGVEPDIAVPAADALDRALIDAYSLLEEQADDDVAARELGWARESLQVRQQPVELDETVLSDYAGDYGIRDISLGDGHLLYQREGGPVDPLIALGEDRFMFADDNAYRVVFIRDRRGRITAMELRVADGRVLNNPRQD